MYLVSPNKKFKKQLRKLDRSGGFNREKLDVLLDMLAGRKELPSTYHDHELKGDMEGFRECHLSGDLIVVYGVSDKLKEILLYEIGSHAEIFG
jgi:mRNA interferase YafQ